VQLIHDQTLRLIAKGMGPRQAAESIYMPRHLRDGREAYGQVESHVRQVWNGTVGWFDGDVYEINPLSVGEEASRTIEMMGGRDAVRAAAARAAQEGGLSNWRWSLKLTSLLLQIDPADAQAREARAKSARALGQRTTSANARGFYLTEALQIEGQLKVDGQPMTLDSIRMFVGTPSAKQLSSASLDENLQFIRYIVDPRSSEGRRFQFTIAFRDEPAIHRVELRNGVLVVEGVSAKDPTHIEVSRQEMSDFIRERKIPAAGGKLFSSLDGVLDRSHLALGAAGASVEAEPQAKAKYNDG
jgi:alkyl sulfatase BDS1-like metallo-beta-lactamase superfamily hydrolase